MLETAAFDGKKYQTILFFSYTTKLKTQATGRSQIPEVNPRDFTAHFLMI
jgi:hypothetical protein